MSLVSRPIKILLGSLIFQLHYGRMALLPTDSCVEISGPDYCSCFCLDSNIKRPECDEYNRGTTHAFLFTRLMPHVFTGFRMCSSSPPSLSGCNQMLEQVLQVANVSCLPFFLCRYCCPMEKHPMQRTKRSYGQKLSML